MTANRGSGAPGSAHATTEQPGAAAAWGGLAGAVALLTARTAGSGEDLADILGEAPRDSVIDVLATLADALLARTLGREATTGLLRDLGLLAASQGAAQ